MGGNATFSGTTFQARVIAYAYVHLLAQMRLGWVPPTDDTPLAISGETGGPGDDARIEFGIRREPIEVQAKHGFTAGAKLVEVFGRIRDISAPSYQTDVVLAVDRGGSSRKLHWTFARDIDRIRTGRTDSVSKDTQDILREFDAEGFDRALLNRLYIAAVDLDEAHQPDSKLAFQLLRSVLEDESQVDAAWAMLVADANDLCARRLRRTRRDLVSLLEQATIKVQPPPKDARWHRQLDFSRQLLAKTHPASALLVLNQLEDQVDSLPAGSDVDPRVRYRIAQQRAAANLQLGRASDALLSARRALEIELTGSHALVAAAHAATELGELETAKSFIDRGIAAHPNDTDLWCAELRLAAASGTNPADPPAMVAESPQYRTMLAQLAADDSDLQRVLDLTAVLLAEGHRPPGVLFLRANSLLSQVGSGPADADRERCLDAERLASDLIETVADESHPLMVKGLVLRGSARRVLGREAEADADLARAQELGHDDPDAIRHAAQAKISARDFAGALELLQRQVVEEVPELIILRAELSAILERETEARHDLEAALRKSTGRLVDDLAVRLQAVDVGLMLGDVDLANSLLNDAGDTSAMAAEALRLRARIAFRQGDVETGAAAYVEAGKQAGTLRPVYLSELGTELLRAGLASEAVSAFEEVGAENLPSDAVRYYAASLFEANELARLQTLIDGLARDQQLPVWALALAADIAGRQENEDAAIAHLHELVELDGLNARARIQLARHLLELGRSADAAVQLDGLLEMQQLAPVERMQLAQLLARSERADEAIPLAFGAFRDRPQDPRMHRALVILLLGRDKEGPVEVREVGPDTHVRLRDQEGEIREHTIYADPPIDSLRGEMSVADAETAGLLRKSVGEDVVRNPGTWHEQRWTVEEIVPAVVHVFRDIMLHYEERFPGEPFFITGFKVGNDRSVRAFAPVIASLEARKASVAEVFALYREHLAPLGMIAEMLGATIPDVMSSTMSDPSLAGPLMVEWSDANGQEWSRAAAFAARETVIAPAALKIASDLGLLDLLATEFEVVAPRSLQQALEIEVAEAEQQLASGSTTLFSGQIGLDISKLESGHPALHQRLEDARARLKWITEFARILPRPLDTIGPVGSREEEVRDLVGPSSHDAAALAQRLGATLYADDLGLRRLVPSGEQHGSFSTVSLLHALAERGVISRAEHSKHLLTLAIRNIAVIRPSRALLEEALRSSERISPAGVQRAFDLLGAPGMTVGGASSMAVQTIKGQVMAPIQLAPTDTIVSLALRGMANMWPVPLCIHTLLQAASDELALLPHVRKMIQDACHTFIGR